MYELNIFSCTENPFTLYISASSSSSSFGAICLFFFVLIVTPLDTWAFVSEGFFVDAVDGVEDDLRMDFLATLDDKPVELVVALVAVP